MNSFRDAAFLRIDIDFRESIDSLKSSIESCVTSNATKQLLSIINLPEHLNNASILSMVEWPFLLSTISSDIDNPFDRALMSIRHDVSLSNISHLSKNTIKHIQRNAKYLSENDSALCQLHIHGGCYPFEHLLDLSFDKCLTSVLNTLTGGPICHSFSHSDKYVLSVVLSGIASAPIAILMHSLHDHSCVLVSRSEIPNKKIQLTELEIFAFNNLILRHTENLNYLSKESNCPKSTHNCSLLVGHRSNFGHTVINETASLGYILSLDKSKLLNTIFIGSHDFLDFYSYLNKKLSNSAVTKLSFHKMFVNKTSIDVATINNSILIPILFVRPSHKQIINLTQFHINNQLSDPNRTMHPIGPAIYLSFDSRKKARFCLNKKEIYACCASISELYSKVYGTPLKIIIDGLTTLPGSSNECKLQSSLYQEMAFENNPNVEVIDGYTFGKKVFILNNYQILASVVPYGSSAMIPIYVLNSYTLLYGAESMGAAAISNWTWHVTKFCHESRTEIETYIPSSTHDTKGYSVNISSMHHSLKLKCSL